jgi:hypothetical protein
VADPTLAKTVQLHEFADACAPIHCRRLCPGHALPRDATGNATDAQLKRSSFFMQAERPDQRPQPRNTAPAARVATLPRPLRGIVPPMITPLRDRDELDVPGLERLIEHILAGGVHGLFILGTSGEAPSLSYRLRRELVDRVCRQVAGRVPVLVGITDTSFVEALHLARHAAAAGAQAVVTSTPY